MIARADIEKAVRALQRQNEGLRADLPHDIRQRLWARGFLADKWDLLRLDARGLEGYLSDLQRLLTRTINGRYGIVLDDKHLLTQALAASVTLPEIVLHLYDGHLELSPRVPSLLGSDQPTALFVKPARGAMGAGVFRVVVGDGSVQVDGASLTPDRFYRRLRDLGRDLIGTVGVVQHPAAAAWYPGTTNTVRVLAIRTPVEAGPQVVLAALRVGVRATEPLDNFSRGGLSFPVDLTSGAVGPGVQRLPQGTAPVTHHPDTGAAIAGTVVPFWPEVVAVALRAMSRLPYLLYVGWDIAVGTDGPVIIEGNNYAGVDVFQVHAPVLACAPLRRFYEHHGILRVTGPDTAGVAEARPPAGIVAPARRGKAAAAGEADGHGADRDSPDDYHAICLRAAATARGIPTRYLVDPRQALYVKDATRSRWLAFSIDGRDYLYCRAILLGPGDDPGTGRGRHINHDALPLIRDKHQTKAYLAGRGFGTPAGRVFHRESLDFALAAFDDFAGPVCVKPNSGGKGRLVSPVIRDRATYERAVRRVAAQHDMILVEESVTGQLIRFFFVRPHVVAVKLSRPASVVGDGRSTLAALVDAKNAWRARRAVPGHIAIRIDDDALDFLAMHGRSLMDVPGPGERVFLRGTSNGATGADSIACTGDDLHPSYAPLIARACNTIDGLHITAADVVIADPQRPAGDGGYWILELNRHPGLTPYHHPWRGEEQDVAGAVLDFLQRHGDG